MEITLGPESGIIADEFCAAEYAVKLIETDTDQLLMPAVNELRYFGNHICRAAKGESPVEEVARARRHIARARYDAYEHGSVITLRLIFNFQKRFVGFGQPLLTVVADYSELILKVEDINSTHTSNGRTIEKRKKDEEAGTLDDPNVKIDADIADSSERYYGELRKIYLKFNLAAPSIEAIVSEQQATARASTRKFIVDTLLAFAGVLIGIAGCLLAYAQLTKDKELPTPPAPAVAPAVANELKSAN